MKRVPRNQVFVLKEADKRLLRKIHRLTHDLPYPPNVHDLIREHGEYGTVLRRLRKLQLHNWIEIYYDPRHRIRAIKVLMLP